MRTRFSLISVLVMVTAVGCVTLKHSGRRAHSAKGGIVLIYGGGSSRPHESDSEVAEHWMTVHVSQSDSTYAFGHVDGGAFEFYCEGFEGRFRARGGERRYFAIRDTLSTVYPLEDFGSYEFSGPVMPPTKAIVPEVDDPYYSIIVLSFAVRDSTITVELVASSPNGFAPAR